ncbi:MAG: GNAT family N-acetyltransferase [Deltaproteobacteria bacterium]|nr:GNAT family N-acetyltransferase [Deltaproteobacteria bacterium]
MIREYRSQDLEDLMAAWEAASALAHSFLSEEFQAQVREDIPKLYLPNSETWVAEQDGRVVGFISLLGNEVGAIFLQPNCHGKGLGRALMDKARELRGELEVEVFTANEIGRAFYAKYGFELVEKKAHPPTGLELLRLRLAAESKAG